MNTSILYDFSDPEFRLTAFKEYSLRAQQRYQEAMNAITGAIAQIPDELPDDFNSETFATEVLQEYGLADSIITIGSDYVGLKNTIISVVNNVINTDMDEFTSLDIPKVNRFNVPAGISSLSLAEIADNMKSSLHSSTAVTAAIQAYDDFKRNGIDYVTGFTSEMEKTWDSVNDDISGVATYALDMVKKATSPDHLLTSIFSLTGLSAEASDPAEPDTDDWNPMLSDMGQYTGSSPAAVYDFSTLQKGLESAYHAAKQVVDAIAAPAKKFLNNIWNKVKKFTYETFENPFDISLVNKNGFNTVDGFRYQQKGFDISISGSEMASANVRPSFVLSALLRKCNKWIAYKFLTCEIMMKFETVVVNADNSITLGNCVLQAKPRVLNWQCLQGMPVLDPQENRTMSELFDWCTSCVNHMNEAGYRLFEVMDQSEDDAFKATAYGFYITSLVIGLGYSQMFSSPDEIVDSAFRYDMLEPSIFRSGYRLNGSTYTNRDWISLFSGFDWNTGTYGMTNPYLSSTNLFVSICDSLLSAFALSQGFEEQYPTEKAPFVPYSNETTEFNEPSFEVKTDAQNNAAFTAAVTAIVAVVIAVIATVTIGVVVKKVTLQMWAKRSAALGSMTQKMNKGELLTNKELRRYMRYKRKNDSCSLFTNGTSGAKSTQSVADIDMAPLISMIKGVASD